VENVIRPFVIGWKNYQFSGSHTAADSSAALYTIIETAKVNGHEQFFYVFSLLPLVKNNRDLIALLPFYLPKKQVIDFTAVHWWDWIPEMFTEGIHCGVLFKPLNISTHPTNPCRSVV